MEWFQAQDEKGRDEMKQCIWCGKPAIKWMKSLLFDDSWVPVCKRCLSDMEKMHPVQTREFTEHK
jgi:hypothetical protein